MTTKDQTTEGTHSPGEAERGPAKTEHLTEHAGSSTDSADPPTAQTESTVPADEPSAAAAPNQASPSVAHSEPSNAPTQSAISSTEAPAEMTQGSMMEDESSPERPLFADDELAGLRARWANVQAGFVDDPKECVHKADGLVSDVVNQLTTGFNETRSRLEEQWARGERASTEDLRLALRRYREFFERLLAV